MTDLSNAHTLPAFKKLVKKRARMVWSLSAFTALVLAGNLYLMSSGAELGSRTLSENGVLTIALAYSIGVIFIGAFTAGFYVWWANTKLDPLMEQTKRDFLSEDA